MELKYRSYGTLGKQDIQQTTYFWKSFIRNMEPLFVLVGAILTRIFLSATSKLIHINYVGPAEITAFTPEALYAVEAPGSACGRTDWYDNILPMKGLISLRNNYEHDQRRKIWEKAFSIKGTFLMDIHH